VRAQPAEDHWAFQQLVKPTPPAVQRTDRVRTPVDRFILAKLEAQRLSLSPDADRVRLARRVYFDLTGLPPSPGEIDQFVADDDASAYERLLDQLLASPHYGIRWGRHWLDIVGYTDSISFDDDYGPPIGFHNGKWRYRDYIVRAFNRNKPYDRFIREQLAGDEMVEWRDAPKYNDEILEDLIATGYLRCCEDISQEDPRPPIIWSVLHDTVRQIGTSFLGLTLQCAQCHNHEYEPIPQADYYRLMALITPAFNITDWKHPQARALPDVSASDRAEIDRHNGEIQKNVDPLNGQIAAIRKKREAAIFNGKLATVSAEIRADVKAAIETPADKRNDIQKFLATKFEGSLKVAPAEIDAALTADDKAAVAELNGKIGTLNSGRRSHGWIQAIYDVGPPPATTLLERGDYLTPGQEVAPGFLTALGDGHGEALLKQKPAPKSSGRRTALARWLTDSESRASGLTARAMVNRIWQHLLGEGIVATSENLGMSGSEPSHPALLNWLAGDFIENRWDIKRLIKKVMMSSVYRQASFRDDSDTDHAGAIDPTNRLLWRARLRRLEAEVIRDAMLAISGKLDDTMGGPPIPLSYNPNGTITVAPNLPHPTAKWRRSLYILNRRVYNVSFLAVFDKPTVTAGVCRRDFSAGALQSLSMMNDGLVLEQSELFARRVLSAEKRLADDRIELVYRLGLGRKPGADEIEWSRELLAQQTELYRSQKIEASDVELKAFAELCQTVLNTNEFLYLE
jgi:hypothetical protein